MSIQAFRKALANLPLSQEDRATLTSDELFVLALAHRFDRLTERERQKLRPEDRSDLAAIGLLVSEAIETETTSTDDRRGCESIVRATARPHVRTYGSARGLGE